MKRTDRAVNEDGPWFLFTDGAAHYVFADGRVRCGTRGRVVKSAVPVKVDTNEAPFTVGTGKFCKGRQAAVIEFWTQPAVTYGPPPGAKK